MIEDTQENILFAIYKHLKYNIMKAGQTDLDVGTRVQLQNIKGEDKELNGLIGSVTHPFAFGETKRGWVGIWLEGGKANMPYGGQLNVRASECKVL